MRKIESTLKLIAWNQQAVRTHRTTAPCWIRRSTLSTWSASRVSTVVYLKNSLCKWTARLRPVVTRKPSLKPSTIRPTEYLLSLSIIWRLAVLMKCPFTPPMPKVAARRYIFPLPPWLFPKDEQVSCSSCQSWIYATNDWWRVDRRDNVVGQCIIRRLISNFRAMQIFQNDTLSSNTDRWEFVRKFEWAMHINSRLYFIYIYSCYNNNNIYIYLFIVDISCVYCYNCTWIFIYTKRI